MVKAPIWLLRHGLVGQEPANVSRQPWRARGPILGAVVALRETAEVVDQRRAGAGFPMVRGAFSQWAETMRMDDGLGSAVARAASCATQSASSTSGGAPCPM